MAFYSEISKANSEHTITDVGYKYSLDYLQLTIPEVNLITVSYPKHLQKYTSSQHGPRYTKEMPNAVICQLLSFFTSISA